jgi:eukaryotic-like serine/threonine-protein kinase
MDDVPDLIGRYRVESVIGRGAMGVIYRAHDPEIDRSVAIKLVRADLLSGNDRSDYIARFRREAQAAGRCLHPNIVTIYDFALHEGNPFIAMELVAGRNLNEVRAGASLPTGDAVAITLQVLDGLAAAHRADVVHRDIKPANILLVNERFVKVTDFGISRINNSDLTLDGTVVGTPSYMSPEQCRGQAVDARSDIFSLGVVLFELLCGKRPFSGPSATAVMQRLLSDEAVDISAIDPAIDPALHAIIHRALAKAPEARYASADDMAAALRALRLSPGGPADSTVVMTQNSAREMVHATDAPKRSSAASASEPTGQFDAAVLATIERKLVRYLGPIAGVVLKSALRPGATIEALCNSLAANIPEPKERERFRAETLSELQRASATMTQSGTGQAPAANTFSAMELERVEKELAQYLGPIARVLVRRAAAQAHSTRELWHLVSHHIERDDERSNFLRRLPS